MSTARPPRSKKGKVENEVERYRAEGNWAKALELLQAYKHDRTHHIFALHNLINCEKLLESCQNDCPTDKQVHDAQAFLRDTLDVPDEQYRLEANILRGKVEFLRKEYTEAIEILKSLKLASVKFDSYALRLARLVSEGLAMIGICVDELARHAGRKMTDEEEKIVLQHYQLAGEICIRYLQEVERGPLEPNTNAIGMPRTVRSAIQTPKLLYLKNGDIQGAITHFRTFLRYVETPSTRPVRQFLSRSLAELLLRGVCTGSYQKYLITAERSLSRSQVTTFEHIPPQRYSTNHFMPKDHLQEAILMLLISECIASQDVILNRPSEQSGARIIRSLNNTTAVYDLLAIALTQVGQFAFLSRTLENSLKFSYRDFHTWFQFGLSLISAQKYYRAYLVLRECQRIDPSDPTVYILASSLCLGKLHLVEEGMELATEGIEVTANRSANHLCSRTHLLLGWGYSLLARAARVRERKRELQLQAVSEYTIASQLDPDDHLVWYHLGVELGLQRRIDEAFSACHRSLCLVAMHSDTLRLLALLHTAGGKHLDRAIKALRVGLNDRPHDFSLLFLLAHIESVLHGPKAGLRIYRQLLEAWRDTFSPAFDINGYFDRLPGAPFVNSQGISDGISLPSTNSSRSGELTLSTAVCPYANDAIFACSNNTEANGPLEKALTSISEGWIGHTGASIAPTSHGEGLSPATNAAKLKARILQGLAELYLEDGKLREAHGACEEAVKIAKLSVSTIYLHGRILEKQGYIAKARAVYEGVIAVDPSHVTALLSLGRLLHDSGHAVLAERVVRDALAVDPTSCQAWHLLAQVLRSPHAAEVASEAAATKALLTAVELEQTEPIQPFSTLPLGLHCA